MKHSSKSSLYLVAIRLLARREYTIHELRQKLLAKNYSLEKIKEVLVELIEKKYLNDERTAIHYIEIKRGRGYGPQFISAKLKTRGISSTLIAELLKMTDNAWLEEARKIWQKRFKGKPPQNTKEAMQQCRFLLYRGFTKQQADELIKSNGDYT